MRKYSTVPVHIFNIHRESIILIFCSNVKPSRCTARARVHARRKMSHLDECDLGMLYTHACLQLGSEPVSEIACALGSGENNLRSRLIELIVNKNIVSLRAETSPSVRVHGAILAHNFVPVSSPKDEEMQEKVARCMLIIVDSDSPSEAQDKLNQFIKPLESRELKRLRKRAKQNSTNIDSNHGEIALPKDSCSRLIACMKYGLRQAEKARGRHAIFIIGNTGSGKSCFCNMLQGCTFEVDPRDSYRMIVSNHSPVPELMKIGHSNKSETLAPQIEPCSDLSDLQGFSFVDCPGFLDNRGFEINIANAVNIKRAIGVAETAKIVVIINYHSLMADRGKGVKDLFRILSSIFGSVQNAKKHAKSMLLGISQAPVTHPITGHQMTLEQHRSRLLDPSGLDEASASLLRAIGHAHVFCFHLMDHMNIIHSSWLRRHDIIRAIKTLCPIPHNQKKSEAQKQESPLDSSASTLFHSAVDSQDIEEFRLLVRKMANKIKSAQILGAFEMSANIAHDLLTLDSVSDDEFVKAVVECELRRVIFDDNQIKSKIADLRDAVRSKKGSTALINSVDGANKRENSEVIDVISENSFEVAISEIQKFAKFMLAFAGIKQLCEELVSLVVNSSLRLEQVARDSEYYNGYAEAEELLLQVAREVGDDVVREIILLPKIKIKMNAKHTEHLRSIQAEQLRIENIVDSTLVKRELVARRLRRYKQRVQGANECWNVYISIAQKRMEEYDHMLLTAEEYGAPAFWLKVGCSLEDLLKADGQKALDWNRKNITETDCSVFAAELRREKLISVGIRRFFLSGNKISDGGLVSIARTTAFGALSNLERFHAQENGVGDLGFSSLAESFENMQRLMLLDLGRNRIGCSGMKHFASIVEKNEEILPNLTTLYLSSNLIASDGIVAFANAVSAQKGTLPRLKILWFNRNKIENNGIVALYSSIASGALRSLEQLMLQGNPSSIISKEDISEVLRSKVSENSLDTPAEADQYSSMRGL